MRLRDAKRVGLFAEHRGVAPVVFSDVRLTDAVLARLRATPGVTVEAAPGDRYAVTLTTHCPAGLHAALVGGGVVVRLDSEPPYPGEYDDWAVAAAWASCPQCGAPLIWYEAGYVPGYRVCARKPHHHWIVG